MAANNLLVLVGYGGGESDAREIDALTATVSESLGLPVETAFLEGSPSVGEGIQNGVETHQPDKVVVLPVFLGASLAKRNNVSMIVDAARDRWPDVVIHEAKPLGTHEGLIRAFRELLLDSLVTGSIVTNETALLVVGRGSRDADSNAEVYQIARLLWERIELGSVEAAFHGSTKPDIAAGIKRCIQTGAKRIIVLPYLLCENPLYESITKQVRENQALYPDVTLNITAHMTGHEGIIAAIHQRYDEALAVKRIRRTGHLHAHGSVTHAHSTPGAEGLQAILPPRYQGDVTVTAAPMSAADLIYNSNGQVAWDEIWGGFCDLALAGGPPHRGTLLEPVPLEQIAMNPEGYQRVWAELERGIRMITGLPIVASRSPGWIGIQCDSEDMALWLLRAIIVENVSVRREDSILYLPVGPDFRLEDEIRNVITVVAKTHHYWKEHRSENVL